jgi:hypothetical protein
MVSHFEGLVLGQHYLPGCPLDLRGALTHVSVAEHLYAAGFAIEGDSKVLAIFLSQHSAGITAIHSGLLEDASCVEHSRKTVPRLARKS